MTMFKSKTLCPLPWLHLSAHTDGSMRICCNTDNGGMIKSSDGGSVYLPDLTTLDDYYNQTSLREIRQKMLNGERPDICSKCYKTEKFGGISLRQVYNKQFTHLYSELEERTAIDGSVKPFVYYADFSLGNHCNLKCRMCNPAASDFIKPEWDNLGFSYDIDWFNRAKTNWEWTPEFKSIIKEVVGTCQQMLFTGGEPFVTDTHYKILELAISEKRSREITLRYHTNLGLLPQKLIELWKQFKSIDVHVSLEGFGDLNDLIRFPSKWAVVDKNFRKLIQLKKQMPIFLEVHTTFQMYTIFGIPKLLDYLKQFSSELTMIPYFIWLDHPNQLEVTVLPLELRREATENINNYLIFNKSEIESGPHGYRNRELVQILSGHLERLLQSPQNTRAREFVAFTEKLDQSRGQNSFKLLPELTSFMN